MRSNGDSKTEKGPHALQPWHITLHITLHYIEELICNSWGVHSFVYISCLTVAASRVTRSLYRKKGAQVYNRHHRVGSQYFIQKQNNPKISLFIWLLIQVIVDTIWSSFGSKTSFTMGWWRCILYIVQSIVLTSCMRGPKWKTGCPITTQLTEIAARRVEGTLAEKNALRSQL